MQKRKVNFIERRKHELLSEFQKKNNRAKRIAILVQIVALVLISILVIFLYQKNSENPNTLGASIIALIINLLVNKISIKPLQEVLFNKKEKRFKSQIDDIVEEEWRSLLCE